MTDTTVGSLLPLLRSRCYDYDDEQANVILAPECEEWTWVTVNLSSWVLDALADCVVECIDVHDDTLRLWMRTSSYGVYACAKNGEHQESPEGCDHDG